MTQSSSEILQAKNLLLAGDVVGIPTETVYGLAASIYSEAGLQRIFSLKERPFFDPLIVHVSNLEQVKECSKYWCEACEVLTKKFWPGPLTLILPKSTQIKDIITSGLDTVGIRMPKHPKTLELIESLGHPIAAPSANKFKKTSPTTAEHVRSEFSKTFVIDGGACEVGIESTIIQLKNKTIEILRPGMITGQDLEDALNENGVTGYQVKLTESPIAPGHLNHHYMPEKPIILEVESSSSHDSSHIPINLLNNSQSWDLPLNSQLAARKLYSQFRNLDHEDCQAIKINLTQKQFDAIEFQGVLNRLIKASTYFLPKEISNKS